MSASVSVITFPQPSQGFAPYRRRSAGLGSTACLLLATLGLFAAAPAHAADPVAIPLGFKYAVDKDGNETDTISRLTIDIGVNGGAARTFMFDTGSSALVGQLGPWDPAAEQDVATYGDGSYGNLVQWLTPTTLDYTTAKGETGHFVGQPTARNSLTRVVLDGSQAYNDMKQICVNTPSQCDLGQNPIYQDKVTDENGNEIIRTWWAVKSSLEAVQAGQPAEEDGTYGTFGAGDFLDKDDKYSALGATTTSGYVISANANQTKGETPTPGCAPCVTLNLNPSLRAQFDTLVAWNVTHGNDNFTHFPGSGANASMQYEGSYTYVFTFEDKVTHTQKTATITGPALLDTGTPDEVFFTQIDAINSLKQQGLDLAENKDQTIISMTITGANGETLTLYSPQLSRLSDEDKGMSLVMGLPLFQQASIMYDLENKLTAYTNYFVSTDNFTTSANGNDLLLNTVTPAMGNSFKGQDGKDYGAIGFAGTISGAGDLTIAANADVRMTGVNTYTGATIINKDAILYLAGPGSIAQSSRVVADGDFNIERHGAFNPLWGVQGTDNTVSIRSLAGSGHVALLDKRLVLTAAGDEFSGSITDLADGGGSAGGGLTVQGGQQILSGANSFTGTTEIASGAALMLRNSGSLVSPVVASGVFGNDGTVSAATTVNSGGTLAGSGQMGDVTIASGGTLTPGSLLDPANTFATLSVDGNLLQQSGSHFIVGVGAQTYSTMAVSGTATIENGVSLAFNPTPELKIGTSYTVLTADGGISGSYDLSLGRISAFVTPTQVLTPTTLSVTAIQDRALVDAAQTPNQISVATAIDSLALSHKVRDELLFLGTDAEARAAFNSLSGESIASIRGALLDDSAYLSRGILRRATGGIVALAVAAESPTVMWMEGETRHMRANSNSEISDVRLRTNGFRLGVDHSFGDVAVGVAFGHGWSKFHTTDRSNEADVKGLHLGVYALANLDNTHIASGWTWSRYRVDGDRIVTYGSINERLDSHWTGKANRLFAEVGHAFGSLQLQVEPYAGLSHSWLSAPAFTETGGAAALKVEHDKLQLTTLRLGARGLANLGAAQLRLGASWENNSGDRASWISAQFTPGSNPFLATGMTLPRNLGAVELGVGFAPISNGWLGVDYGGRFAKRFNDHRGRISFDYRF